MSKKVLIIKGSCRKDSFTNKILQEAFKNVENIDLDIFDAYSEGFAFCNGCNYCENTGRCINKDLDEFFLSFENADVVVFASPVYNGGFSAPISNSPFARLVANISLSLTLFSRYSGSFLIDLMIMFANCGKFLAIATFKYSSFSL